jgi:hypothetical protein
MKYMNAARKFGRKVAIAAVPAVFTVSAMAGDFDGMTSSEASTEVKAAIIAIGVVLAAIAWVILGKKRVLSGIK